VMSVTISVLKQRSDRLYPQLFVGGLMYCLVVFTLSCLLEGLCIVCSSLVPVVCWRAHVLFVRLYLQLFV
jgi:hypothetical protein